MSEQISEIDQQEIDSLVFGVVSKLNSKKEKKPIMSLDTLSNDVSNTTILKQDDLYSARSREKSIFFLLNNNIIFNSN